MSEPRNRHALEKSISEIEADDGEQSEELETLDVVPPLSPGKPQWSGGPLSVSTSSFTFLQSHLVDESIAAPPSFAESQFHTIVRRQRPRDTALKIPNIPSRYPNLLHDFEFAGCVAIMETT